jgi:O-antigen ligase
MLIRRPILGWGLGTFPIVYPEFRSFYTNMFVNQAHNDYLQLLVETGLAGFSIAVWFLVLVFRQAAGKLKNWTENASGALTVAALLGCVGILVHSFLDFNLQIPANAALFYVLCAIAASKPLQESQAPPRTSPAQFDRGVSPGNRGILSVAEIGATQAW